MHQSINAKHFKYRCANFTDAVSSLYYSVRIKNHASGRFVARSLKFCDEQALVFIDVAKPQLISALVI